MDPYAGFAQRFDLLIDWERRRTREEAFFRRVLSDNVKSVLDCYCGTGFHCVMLGEMGYEVEGVDSSPEMLQVARQHAESEELDIKFHCSDVKAMLPALDRQFDCVLSMGNSLPHEMCDEDLLKALYSMREALAPGGTCIVHTEDFDALYRDRDRFIPSRFRRHGNGAEAFIFAIDYYRSRVIFNILSIIERGGKSEFHVDVVEYNPVRVGKLERLMRKAGFRDIAVYCDFLLTPRGMRDTYDAIFVAQAPD